MCAHTQPPYYIATTKRLFTVTAVSQRQLQLLSTTYAVTTFLNISTTRHMVAHLCRIIYYLGAQALDGPTVTPGTKRTELSPVSGAGCSPTQARFAVCVVHQSIPSVL